jgi:hypothetical protein
MRRPGKIVFRPLETVSTSGNSGIVTYIVSVIIPDMDSLNDILRTKDFTEPRESQAIKDFVNKRFQENVGVKLQKDSIIIVSGSSSLADTLRQLSPQLQKAADTTKKLIFRIG